MGTFCHRLPDHCRRGAGSVDQEGCRMITPDYTARPILSARNLMKRYGRVIALDNADFELYPGEILGVIGDNGAGKSTMIKVLSGAVQPESGEIMLEGKPVSFSNPLQAREQGIETV
ncbi:MAG TPA: ATP-binding cassette domain-containing protein, partial [Devosia sp.]|nr:ATP-binding cassette domain-containing protein [Devosia sp.]